MHATMSPGQVSGLDVLLVRRSIDAAAVRISRELVRSIGRASGRRWAALQGSRRCAAVLALSEHLLRDIGVARREVLAAVGGQQVSWRSGP